MKPVLPKIGVRDTGYGTKEVVHLREKLWSEAETKILIQLYREHQDVFSNHTLKVSDAWELISKKLKAQNISKSAKDCDKKFRNLKSAFKRVHLDKERSEQSKYQWDLYEELLDVFLSNKPILRRVKGFAPAGSDKPEPVKLHNNRKQILTVHYTSPSSTSGSVVVNDIDGSELIGYQEDPEEGAFGDDAEKDVINIVLDEEEPMEEVVEEESKRDLSFEEPPAWFQSFLIKHEAHTKMVREQLCRIEAHQEHQNSLLEHFSTKIAKIEKKLTDLSK